MDELSLVGWMSYDADYPNINFKEHDQNAVLGLVLREISGHGYAFSGQDHQNRDACVPLFSNGCVLRCSMRAWGMIMASAHKEMAEEGPDYMAFYMDAADPYFPERETAFARGEDNDALPVLIGPDQELIMQTLEFGIDLMTLDKAIREMFPLYKRRYLNQN